MYNNSIRVFAPASVSNVGPGFDIMGFALDEPGDEIILSINDSGKIKITEITGDNGVLPYDPEKNTATVALKSLLNGLDISVGLDVEINKRMGIGSGLGSSAASAVAGVFALNELMDLNCNKEFLLAHALNGEQIASGAIHADNVAPCLFGGFLLIRGYNPVDIVKIPVPANLHCTVIYPDIVVNTSEARELLDLSFPIEAVISQAGNAAGLIAGLYSGDYNLISRSLVDKVAEHKRARLLPFYDSLKYKAKELNAINCNISGSGPAMFSFSKSREEAEMLAEELTKVVAEAGYGVKTYVSQVNPEGPKVLD